jgi:hypothetical protein
MSKFTDSNNLNKIYQQNISPVIILMVKEVQASEFLNDFLDSCTSGRTVIPCFSLMDTHKLTNYPSA